MFFSLTFNQSEIKFIIEMKAFKEKFVVLFNFVIGIYKIVV